MKNILIVEDKIDIAQSLKKIIEGIDEDVEIYIAHMLKDAYKIAMEIDLDLFLLDIVLDTTNPNDVSGIKFADKMRQNNNYKFTPIIFVTSLEDPKMYSYENIHCYSYIEKPFEVERTRRIISEALQYVKVEKEQKVYFRKDGVLYAKNKGDIVHITNLNRIVTIHTQKDKLTIPYIPCGKLIKELDSRRFVQCSKSNIVNKDYIDTFDRVNKYISIKGSDERIAVGRYFMKKMQMELENDSKFVSHN